MTITRQKFVEWLLIIWLWRRGVVVITTAQLYSTKPELRLPDNMTVAPWCSGCHYCKLYSTKPELRFCAGSNPAPNVWEIRDGEDLWQWYRLKISLNAFRRSTIPQKQLISFIKRLEYTLHRIWSFPLRISSVNKTIFCNLVPFTESILNRKLHFLNIDNYSLYSQTVIKTNLTLGYTEVEWNRLTWYFQQGLHTYIVFFLHVCAGRSWI